MASEKRNIPISLPVTGEDEWQAVKEPFMTGWLTSGPKVRQFEAAFGERHNTKFNCAVTSCTTGLHLALAALGVGEGDEVIVPAFTWVATANAALYVGAEAVFCDIDPTTFNLDVSKLEALITDKTKAIIPVHLFGLCADMDAIKAISGDIPLIEDAACAAGAEYKGNVAGSLGDLASFSFHPRKSITTGEGGMVTTNREDMGALIEQLRNHGAAISEEQRHHGPKPYILPDFNILGFNFRMTDIQGAVGVVQLTKLDKFIDERAKWAAYYIDALKDISWLRTPHVPEGYRHGWQSFVTFVDESIAPMKRNDIMEVLQQQGIATRPGTHAVHMLNFYKDRYNIQEDDFPGAKLANNHSMAIPLHNRMVKEDYDYVIAALKAIQ